MSDKKLLSQMPDKYIIEPTWNVYRKNSLSPKHSSINTLQYTQGLPKKIRPATSAYFPEQLLPSIQDYQTIKRRMTIAENENQQLKQQLLCQSKQIEKLSNTKENIFDQRNLSKSSIFNFQILDYQQQSKSKPKKRKPIVQTEASNNKKIKSSFPIKFITPEEFKFVQYEQNYEQKGNNKSLLLGEKKKEQKFIYSMDKYKEKENWFNATDKKKKASTQILCNITNNSTQQSNQSIL